MKDVRTASLFESSEESEILHPPKPKKFIKPPFGYLGAKQRMANRIVELLPPHNAWVEAFCGSAAITLAKQPAEIEVINDLDGQVVNLFRVLREQPDELRRALQLTPYAREEFDLARANEPVQDPLEKARRFLVGTMMTVNGTLGTQHAGFSYSDSYVRGGREARVNRWYQLPERLEPVVERLRSIRIENKDARDILDQFSKRPATLVYLDPPYLTERRANYAVDANESSFHEDLLTRASKAECMILISGYESELYSDMLQGKDGWVTMELEVKTRGTKGKDTQRTEILWLNAAFYEGVQTKRSRVSLTAKERYEKKVNPERLYRKPLPLKKV